MKHPMLKVEECCSSSDAVQWLWQCTFDSRHLITLWSPNKNQLTNEKQNMTASSMYNIAKAKSEIRLAQ